MGARPSDKVVAAIVGASTSVTRRAAIYEQDGVTPWRAADNVNPRLIDGSIAISGTSESERRTADCILENLDGVLNSYPGGFWYDKVIKIFRGVSYDKGSPKIIIIEDVSSTASTYKTMLLTFGYKDITVKTTGQTYAQLLAYDVIIALGGAGQISAGVSTTLQALYAAGKAVFTNGNDSTSARVPLIATTQTKGTSSPAYRIEPIPGTDHYAASGWLAEDQSGDTGTLPITVRTGAVPIAKMTFAATLSYTAISETNTAKGRWFHYHEYIQGAQATVMLKKAFDWLDDARDRTVSWETQVGEFMIDEITTQNEPNTVKLKLRDYVKKCRMSSFTKATTFKKGQSLDVVVRAIASNAGVTKINIPNTGKSLGRDFAFESGTERWKAMVDLATAFSYDIYFDNTGTLVMTPFADPAGLSSTFTFKTGKNGGNLAGYEKTTNDTRIYNHIVVIGQAANSIPIYGEALNTVAGSPTSVAELGDRVYRYNSSYITTQDQANATAKSFLAQYALEEFSLNLSSIVVPWLEAGQVVDFIDPSPSPGDPSRFLMTDFSIPLGLGPMSANAKRVRQVLS